MRFLKRLMLSAVVVFGLGGTTIVSTDPIYRFGDKSLVSDFPDELGVIVGGKALVLKKKTTGLGRPSKTTYEFAGFSEITFHLNRQMSDGRTQYIMQAKRQSDGMYVYTAIELDANSSRPVWKGRYRYATFRTDLYDYTAGVVTGQKEAISYSNPHDVTGWLSKPDELDSYFNDDEVQGIGPLIIFDLTGFAGSNRFEQMAASSNVCSTNACFEMSPKERFQDNILAAIREYQLSDCNRAFFLLNGGVVAVGIRPVDGWCVADLGIATLSLRIESISGLSCSRSDAPMTCSFTYRVGCRFTTIAKTRSGDDLLCDGLKQVRQPATATFEKQGKGLRVTQMKLAKP